MNSEHVLTPDDKCPCGKPQTGSGYCSYECYSKHEPEPTSSASMGGPLSEADRLAEIQARFKNRVTGHWHAVSIEFRGQTSHSVKSNVGSVLAHTGYGPVGGSSHANAEFMANAPADIEFLLNLVGVLEGQLATAREEATELGAKLKDFLDGQFRISKVIGETEDKFEQQRLLGLAEARATLRAALDGCDDFMVPTIRACTGCGKCSYCAARGITAASVLGLDGGGSDAE